MKKELLLIAAAATMLTACVNTEDFRDVNIQQNSENDGAIGFTSFTDKMTKGINDKAENSEALYTWTFWNHQESFQVWARKANQPEKEIFGGTKVTVTRTGDAAPYTYTYTYDPARFWDKAAASYQFFAAAPAQPDGESPAWTWDFTHTANDLAGIANGYFSTESTLNGVNLQSVANSGPTTALKNVFKGTTDIDKLIAAPCQVTNTYYNKPVPDAVNLNFIHILSKLNVTISTSLVQTTGGHNYDVDILGFEINGIPNNGTFNENTNTFTAHGKNIRWGSYGNTITKIETGIDNNTNKKDVPLTTGDKLYIVESLIIPQNINYERIALDGLAHNAVNQPAVPYQSYEEYEAAKNNDNDRLAEAVFNTLITDDGNGGKTFANGISDANKAEITKIEAKQVDAYSTPTEPYFTISYSIDGEVFTANYNLAAAFLNYNNNNQKWDSGNLVNLVTTGDNQDPQTFGFYEGWQNTLNIIINPTEIKFTADVAEWDDIEEKTYEIEKGNENPNTPAPANP